MSLFFVCNYITNETRTLFFLYKKNFSYFVFKNLRHFNPLEVLQPRRYQRRIVLYPH